MGNRKNAVSSDYTMSQWPSNLDQDLDIINPYPCCTCKQEFRSTRKLRTHECHPGKRSVNA